MKKPYYLGHELILFTTGGTFDKVYNPLTGQLDLDRTHVPEVLTLGRSRVPIEIEQLMTKDSLEMTPADRDIILSACKRPSRKHIIITHGTDTMTQTADYLAQANLDKTIVLTGAMIPYSFGSSDGLFNLGTAIAFSQSLPHGVYIAMNGQCFPAGSVEKNTAEGYFQVIDKEDNR